MLFSVLLAAASPVEAAPLTIGDQYEFEAMDASREVNVVLPDSYSTEPDRRYPVVYMLDGGSTQDLLMQAGLAHWTQMWGRTEEFILVGVETKDRQRELLPPTKNKEALDVWPTAGESVVFRDYLAGDVMPMIEATYRTDERDYLVGESAAGHFVVETLLVAPEMFDGYAAIDPSLWWEDQLLARRAEQGASAKPGLFISIADEGETMDKGVRRIVAKRKKDSAPTCFADRPDLTHAIAYHTLLPSALQYLLPGKKDLPDEWGMVTGCVD